MAELHQSMVGAESLLGSLGRSRWQEGFQGGDSTRSQGLTLGSDPSAGLSHRAGHLERECFAHPGVL